MDVNQNVSCAKNADHGVNVLALIKEEERYLFIYCDAYKSELLKTFGRFASNPDLSFTWHDAAVLSNKLQQNSDIA